MMIHYCPENNDYPDHSDVSMSSSQMTIDTSDGDTSMSSSPSPYNFRSTDQMFLQSFRQIPTQCSANIRKCFKKRILDESMQGGYYEFVQKMEMKIKMNDSVIKEEINNPSLWSFAGETSEQFEEKSKNVQQRLLAEAMLACQAPYVYVQPENRPRNYLETIVNNKNQILLRCTRSTLKMKS